MKKTGSRWNLRRFRYNKGLTQAEMADMLGYSRTRYNQIECGASMPQTYFMSRMGEVFGLKPEEVLRLLERHQAEKPEKS